MKKLSSNTIVIIFLIAVVVLINIRLFAPKHEVIIKANTFNIEEGNEEHIVVNDNGEIVFEKTGELVTISMPEITLPRGAYSVDIYKIPINSSGNYYEELGHLKIESESQPSALLFDTALIQDGETVYSTKVWNTGLASVTDAKITLWYYGLETMQLNEIVIRESVLYRMIQLLVSSCMAIIMYGCYYFIFCHKYLEKEYKFTKYIAVSFATILFASLPMFQNFIMDGHDLCFHLNRITALATEFGNGVFPVRIAVDDLNGYGYANSIFYCDIFLYLPALLYKCAVPLRTCYQMYVILVNIFTYGIALFSFYKITKHVNISMVGAIFYVLAPYRFTNLYIRTAVGEYTAMVFLPLIIAGVYLIYTQSKIKFQDWSLLALGMSGIIMSHILTTQMAVIFLVITCLVLIKKTLQKEKLLAFIKAAGLTILITAWFIVPFVESYLTTATVVTTEYHYKIQSHGLYLIQLFSEFMSATGLSEVNKLMDEMPLSLGLTALVGIGAIIYCCIYREKIEKDELTFYKPMILILGLGCCAIAFTLRIFPWDSVESVVGEDVYSFLSKVQFSWRYLSIATPLLITGSILALRLLRSFQNRLYQILVMGMVMLTILSTSFLYYGVMNKQIYTATVMPQVVLGKSHINVEYLLEGSRVVHMEKRTIIPSHNAVTYEQYYREDGNTYISVFNGADTLEYITLPILNYNYYVARDTVTGEEYTIKNGYNNCLSVELPPYYEGGLTITYEPPFTWRIAEIISVISVIAICILYIKNSKVLWKVFKFWKGKYEKSK